MHTNLKTYIKYTIGLDLIKKTHISKRYFFPLRHYLDNSLVAHYCTWQKLCWQLSATYIHIMYCTKPSVNLITSSVFSNITIRERAAPETIIIRLLMHSSTHAWRYSKSSKSAHFSQFDQRASYTKLLCWS